MITHNEYLGGLYSVTVNSDDKGMINTKRKVLGITVASTTSIPTDVSEETLQIRNLASGISNGNVIYHNGETKGLYRTTDYNDAAAYYRELQEQIERGEVHVPHSSEVEPIINTSEITNAYTNSERRIKATEELCVSLDDMKSMFGDPTRQLQFDNTPNVELKSNWNLTQDPPH